MWLFAKLKRTLRPQTAPTTVTNAGTDTDIVEAATATTTTAAETTGITKTATTVEVVDNSPQATVVIPPTSTIKTNTGYNQTVVRSLVLASKSPQHHVLSASANLSAQDATTPKVTTANAALTAVVTAAATTAATTATTTTKVHPPQFLNKSNGVTTSVSAAAVAAASEQQAGRSCKSIPITGAGHVIYQALGAKNQMLGCDRELFMLNLLIAAAFIFTSMDTTVAIFAIALAIVIFMFLRYMGRKDLLLRHVYLRQLHYRSFYLAQAVITSTPHKAYGRK